MREASSPLAAHYGDEYRAYQSRVLMLFPRLHSRACAWRPPDEALQPTRNGWPQPLHGGILEENGCVPALAGQRCLVQRAPIRRGSGQMARKASTILKAWLFHAEVVAWLLALALIIAAEPTWAAASALLALGAHVAGRRWSRKSPAPMPYFMRWILLVPRGPHSPGRVQQMLNPSSGERILEIGPGVGVHAVPIAAVLRPDGVLDVLDAQQEMLDDLMRRAANSGVSNIVASQGDAQHLPYADAAFDAAYLVSVLGEIPDAKSALRELRRVLKPGARLLVCEVLLDPDFISLPDLRMMARDAGFEFVRQSGPRFAYTALFRPMYAAG